MVAAAISLTNQLQTEIICELSEKSFTEQKRGREGGGGVKDKTRGGWNDETWWFIIIRMIVLILNDNDHNIVHYHDCTYMRLEYISSRHHLYFSMTVIFRFLTEVVHVLFSNRMGVTTRNKLLCFQQFWQSSNGRKLQFSKSYSQMAELAIGQRQKF